MIKKPSIKPKILVILGPTATGKSDLAVEIARAYNGEVISADSRQVYRGMNLGTGKITKREMKGIAHHLLDVISPIKVFTASQFQVLAREAISDILSRGKLPILCGGTGFYIQSIIDGTILPDVDPNPELRKKLGKLTPEQLYARLKKLDPKRAKQVDPQNHVRLIRSIEIAIALGKVPKIKKDARYEVLQIGLDLPDKILKEKILKRIHSRLKKGMVTEARRLHKSGVSYKRLRALGLEYRYLADLAQKKISKNEFIDQLAISIFQYVKRQRAWFRRDANIKWFLPKQTNAIKKLAKSFITKSGDQ